jgi:hypothetical protein
MVDTHVASQPCFIRAKLWFNPQKLNEGSMIGGIDRRNPDRQLQVGSYKCEKSWKIRSQRWHNQSHAHTTNGYNPGLTLFFFFFVCLNFFILYSQKKKKKNLITCCATPATHMDIYNIDFGFTKFDRLMLSDNLIN